MADNIKMNYLGVVRLLVEKHNLLQSVLLMNDESVDDDSIAAMEWVASDFNRISETFEMVNNGDGKFAIFQKGQFDG